MPIASGTYQGTETQEMIIMALLLSLSVAMVLFCISVLWGLRTSYNAEPQINSELQANSLNVPDL